MFSKVSRFWAIMFMLFAIGFAIFPAGTGEALTYLANFIGLSGVIFSGGVSLWWVLSLSMMITIYGLAWSIPHQGYPALMTCKLSSTVLFTALAVHDPAWLVCAAGDGFVALTLWLAKWYDKKRETADE